MKNKKWIVGLVALVVLLAVMAGVWMATRPEASQGAKTITVTVVHSDGSSKQLTYHTDAEYLSEVLVAEGLMEPSDNGMYYTVDGETADYDVDQSYWAFYVGEEYAMQGMDDTPVNDGDSFKLEYTK